MGRVYLLASHVWLAETLALLLERCSHGELSVVGLAKANNVNPDALAAARTELVLLAVGMDSIDGMLVATAVRRALPAMLIVVVDTMGEVARTKGLYPQMLDAVLSVDLLHERLAPTLIELIANHNQRGSKLPLP